VTRKPWLASTIISTCCYGVWGAFIDAPARAGFPATLSYVVWSLTMVPCAALALRFTGWRLEHDRRSIWLGAVVGFLGAGGQVVLFEALRLGPAYLIFPIVALSPVVTILLSWLFLGEDAGRRGWTGIVLAVIAIPLLSYQPPGDGGGTSIVWVVLALIVFAAWGIQAYYLKPANAWMTSESVFFYMTVTGVMLAPVTIAMTDFTTPINWGISGPWLAAGIQLLNAIGSLGLVYAFRYGRAIIVSPLINAVAPVMTVLVSLLLYRVIPHPVVSTGIIIAIAATVLIALEPERPAEAIATPHA